MRPPQRNPAMVSTYSPSSQNVEITVVLTCGGKSFTTTAMIDSGAAANLIDANFARTHNIPLIPCNSVLAVAALDGRPLGSGLIQYTTEDVTLQTGALHQETIRFFLIESPQNPIILGLPWLQQHNPTISWTGNQITQWSDSCMLNCIQPLANKSILASTDEVLPASVPNLPTRIS